MSSSVATEPTEPAENWVATWGASPAKADVDDTDAPPLRVSGQTIREILRVSAGGSRVRVSLSNAFGTVPLHVGTAHVAPHASGSSIDPQSDRPLTFAGASSVTIPPGGIIVSDPAPLVVPALSELAVSLYLPDAVTVTTAHATAIATTYVSTTGDQTAAANLAQATTTESWYFVTAVDVDSPVAAEAIVALGDSITDGVGSTRDANHRWADRLAERLHASPLGASRTVVNEGISGNRLLHDLFGTSALSRFDVDVLGQTGAKYVIVLEGINDFALPGVLHLPNEETTADQVIAAHRQLIDRAHARGATIFGGTMTPFEGTKFPGYYTAAGAAKRDAFNQWIRTSKAYDAVIDFDAALRDPAHPQRLLSAYDSGDHLHPNDAGHKAMADSVDLALFASSRAAHAPRGAK